MVFTTVPFGLSCSPGFASLALLSILSHLKDIAFYYVDDICLPAASIEDMLTNLRQVFTELRKANLSLNAKKCVFMDDHAKFLGHVISKHGFTMIPKYSTDVIRNWGSPSNQKSLSRWLSAMSWFRREIPAFAKRTAPLRKLLKSDNFIWLPEHEKIFREINESIIEPPVLRPLDSDGPVYILTDASSEGCAYAICQKGQDNRLHPCYFGGQAVTDCQSRWPPFHLEILAIIQALNNYHSILSSRQIIAVTDNATLANFNNLHLNSPRLRRWSYLL